VSKRPKGEELLFNSLINPKKNARLRLAGFAYMPMLP